MELICKEGPQVYNTYEIVSPEDNILQITLKKKD